MGLVQGIGIGIPFNGIGGGSSSSSLNQVWDGITYIVTTLGGTMLRWGIRDGYDVEDITLTALGFDGVQNTDWENVSAIPIPKKIQDIVVTSITGGNRITFTPIINHQTEIWYSLDGAAYTMLGRYADTVTSVDHTGLYANIIDYKLRGVFDDATYDSDAVAYFNRMGAAAIGEYPVEARKVILNTLFTTGKTKAFWNKLDAAWLIGAHGAGSAKLNILSSSFPLTQYGVACDFEVDRGYTTAANKYLITGYNPTTHADNYSLNSASLGVYCRTNTSGTGTLIGTGTAGNTTYVMFLSGNCYSQINGTAYTTTPTANIQKLITGRRLASGTMAMFLDKVKDEEAKASAAVPNLVVEIGKGSYNQFSFAFIAGGLDDTDVSDMYDVIVDGYLASIGAKI